MSHYTLKNKKKNILIVIHNAQCRTEKREENVIIKFFFSGVSDIDINASVHHMPNVERDRIRKAA